MQAANSDTGVFPDRWLRGKAFDVEEVKDMLARYFEEVMTAWPVGKLHLARYQIQILGSNALLVASWPVCVDSCKAGPFWWPVGAHIRPIGLLLAFDRRGL